MSPQPASRADLELVKIAALAEGITLSAAATDLLSAGGTTTLSIHEYPTTGGITVELDRQVYLNAPFDEWWCSEATTVLDVDGIDATGRPRLVLRNPQVTVGVVRVLPLPGYLDEVDAEGRLAADVAMSHADRIRVSPIVGCAYDCGFCDLPAEAYTRRGAEQLLAASAIAERDPGLPPRHAMISGGSPRKTHYDEFIDTCEAFIRGSALPVDVMFSPMIDRPDLVPRLVAAGAAGFAINLEVFAAEPAREALRGKYQTVRDHFESTVVQAVELLGRTGRVRSLIIVGLEAPEQTLAGVEYLASLGCSPVLSPFRPAAGTRLHLRRPPTAADLTGVLAESRSIAALHGVDLGPDCAPCQHNTLTFPWDLDARTTAVPA